MGIPVAQYHPTNKEGSTAKGLKSKLISTTIRNICKNIQKTRENYKEGSTAKDLEFNLISTAIRKILKNIQKTREKR